MGWGRLSHHSVLECWKAVIRVLFTVTCCCQTVERVVDVFLLIIRNCSKKHARKLPVIRRPWHFLCVADTAFWYFSNVSICFLCYRAATAFQCGNVSERLIRIKAFWCHFSWDRFRDLAGCIFTSPWIWTDQIWPEVLIGIKWTSYLLWNKYFYITNGATWDDNNNTGLGNILK